MLFYDETRYVLSYLDMLYDTIEESGFNVVTFPVKDNDLSTEDVRILIESFCSKRNNSMLYSLIPEVYDKVISIQKVEYSNMYGSVDKLIKDLDKLCGKIESKKNGSSYVVSIDLTGRAINYGMSLSLIDIIERLDRAGSIVLVFVNSFITETVIWADLVACHHISKEECEPFSGATHEVKQELLEIYENDILKQDVN